MSWSEDGIEYKKSWWKNRREKKLKEERIKRMRQEIVTKAFETTFKQIYGNNS